LVCLKTRVIAAAHKDRKKETKTSFLQRDQRRHTKEKIRDSNTTRKRRKECFSYREARRLSSQCKKGRSDLRSWQKLYKRGNEKKKGRPTGAEHPGSTGDTLSTLGGEDDAGEKRVIQVRGKLVHAGEFIS